MSAHPDGSSIGLLSRAASRASNVPEDATGRDRAGRQRLAAGGVRRPGNRAGPDGEDRREAGRPATGQAGGPRPPRPPRRPLPPSRPMRSRPPAGKPGGRLEMFSWWTTGGEEAGLKAMYAIFEKSHPGVEIVNQAVAGAAGSNAKAVLKTRMQGGDPPDSFQVHMGRELTDGYVAAEPGRAAQRPLQVREVRAGVPEGRAGDRLGERQLLVGAGQHPPRQRPLVQQEGARRQPDQPARDVRRLLQRRREAEGEGDHAAGARATRSRSPRPTSSRRCCWACSARTATRGSGPAPRSGRTPRSPPPSRT